MPGVFGESVKNSKVQVDVVFWFHGRVSPCVIFEDDHLLVVNKPAGLNTHSPSQYAGEGLYEWLRNREPRWAALAIIHRLDKDTSGLIIFSKTPLANRSLTEQFAARKVRKKYVLATDRPVPPKGLIVKTSLKRVGEKYVSRPIHAGSEPAETRFGVPALADNLFWVEAEPITGRTHQIRVHAAESGFPVLGDTLYGGISATRVHLHAAELAFFHPTSGEKMEFQCSPDFRADPRLALRTGLIDLNETNAFRLINGAGDGAPGWYVERLGEFLLSQGEQELTGAQLKEIERRMHDLGARGLYHKIRARADRPTSAPNRTLGQAAGERFAIRENGVQFELSFSEGYSTGLFLDQRDNRRRLLTGYISPGFCLPAVAKEHETEKLQMLNTFAYTCGFSVCAAKVGWHTTSIDLSKKYLDWGKRNFLFNQIDPAEHEFLRGDVFDWLARLAKKQRRFDLILLDPPTFSASKRSGAFQVQKHYSRLTTAALPLLNRDGVIFASTNAADWPPQKFLESVQNAVHSAKRPIIQLQYIPQPPDFPISRGEPAYLKTVWLKL